MTHTVRRFQHNYNAEEVPSVQTFLLKGIFITDALEDDLLEHDANSYYDPNDMYDVPGYDDDVYGPDFDDDYDCFTDANAYDDFDE